MPGFIPDNREIFYIKDTKIHWSYHVIMSLGVLCICVGIPKVFRDLHSVQGYVNIFIAIIIFSMNFIYSNYTNKLKTELQETYRSLNYFNQMRHDQREELSRIIDKQRIALYVLNQKYNNLIQEKEASYLDLI